MSGWGGLGAVPRVVWRWTSVTPQAPAKARAALRGALDELGFGTDAVTDSMLAVSEIVTNAVRHAVGPYELRLRSTSVAVICEVEDRDPRALEMSALPAGAPYEPMADNRGGGAEALYSVLSEQGRGLHIVHELSEGVWGFHYRARTKIAWFAVPGRPRRTG